MPKSLIRLKNKPVIFIPIYIYIFALQLHDHSYFFYFCFSPLEEFLYSFLFFSLPFFILRFRYGLVKLSTAETVHRTKTDHFLARSHMVSVNEQSSPILDVERGPAKSKEMRTEHLTVSNFTSRDSSLRGTIFEEYSLITREIFFH